MLQLVRSSGPWLLIRYQDPESGLREGFVESRYVRIESANLTPIDLSVPAVAGQAAAQRAPAPSNDAAQLPVPSSGAARLPAPRTVTPPAATRAAAPPTVTAPSQASVPAQGQSQAPQTVQRPDPIQQRLANESAPSDVPNHVLISFSFLNFVPRGDERTTTYTFSRFGETAAVAASYPSLKAIQSAELGFTVPFGAEVGAGFRWLQPRYESVAGLGASIPHPTIFNRYGTDGAISPILERKDTMLDLFASYIYNARRVVLIASGGPTYFSIKQDMVSTIRYTQVATVLGTNNVTITGADVVEASGSTWGLNGGLDVSYFIWRQVGVGGGIKYNYGKMKLEADPLTGEEADIKLGSLSFTAGARFRF